MRDAPPGLAWRRHLARAALWWEQAWPALWPAAGLAGAGVAAALLDLPARLPPGVHAALLLLFAIALAVTLWHRARRLRWPGQAAVDRRLERASGLAHRPLAALADRPPASATPAQMALWRAHLARAAAQVRHLRVGWPRPGLAARDRRALRAALVVALVAALVIAGPEAPERLARAAWPAFAAGPAPVAARLEAWITPPAYTGLAPLFLDPAGGSLSVPAGARLSLSLTGGAGGVPELVMDGQARPMRRLDASSFAAEEELARGGRLAVRRDGSTLAGWDVAVIADAPPAAAFPAPPGPDERAPAVRLPWQATDDWGLAGLRAELRLRARPDAPPLVLDLPLPAGAPKAAQGTLRTDLSAHPWAGLDVMARLVARDGAGQEGASAEAAFTLPERAFDHPVARALASIRRELSRTPWDRAGAMGALDALSADPDAFDNDTTTFLGLRSARHRLLHDRSDQAVGAVQALLWELALRLEEGESERTARALAEAREALREALERQDRGEAVSAAEIDRLMRELREALERHLDALDREAARAQPEAADPREAQRLDREAIEREAGQLERAMRDNRRADARRAFAELERMLRQLEAARPGRQQREAARRERGRQQMGALQDMVQREGSLLDNSHQRAGEEQAERRSLWRQPAPPQADRGPEAGQARDLDRRRQEALRRALGELMQQFGDMTGDIPAPLAEADQAMREAAQALREGSDGAARDAQRRAIEALQEGGRAMSRQLARQGEQGNGEEEGGDARENATGPGVVGRDPGGRDGARQGAEGRDPLGRRTPAGPTSADEGADVVVPEEAEASRARAIQEELRRRGAERSRPQPELDYIDRLLRPF